MRSDYLARLKNAANQSNQTKGLNTAGNGPGAGGVSAGYADKVRRVVLPNINFNPDSVPGNPAAVVALRCAPDGTVLSAGLARSSGNSAWDEAVLQAIRRSGAMPRDIDGSAPPSFTITFRPKR
jgi:colicin import membrane protein